MARRVLLAFIVVCCTADALKPGYLRAQHRDEITDTLRAIDELRRATSRNDNPERLCLLGTLLARLSTAAQRDHRMRYEAQRAFERALSRSTSPECLYEFALLREKQGTRTEAARLMRRIERTLTERPELVSNRFRAELLYRQALFLDDWLRNFDYLVRPLDLAVSTPACVIAAGYFCENFARPRDFNRRLNDAPSLAGAIADQRLELRRVLDSVRALDPRHADATRLSLRRALIDGDWESYEHVARVALAVEPGFLLGHLALLAADVQRGELANAGRKLGVIDSLVPDSLRATYERIAVIGSDTPFPDAVWAASDPLYLTPHNERRLAHYARLALADIAFTDPGTRQLGRDTQPGRLVLRYGWPRHIWEVRRDRRLEITPWELETALQILSCQGDLGCELAALRSGPQTSFDQGGRWMFFNYDLDLPSFVFERELADRSYRYKQFTLTEDYDSALARVAPSTYESPFWPAALSALVTRFPRLSGPTVEVYARFRWDSPSLERDSATLGVFVHERRSGALVNRGTSRIGATQQDTRFHSVLRVNWGRQRLAVEGLSDLNRNAAQIRFPLEMSQLGDSLSLSDVLLGDTVFRDSRPRTRASVSINGRPDSIFARGATMALLWEVYGLRPNSAGADPAVALAVNVSVTDERGTGVLAEALGPLARLLGTRPTQDRSVEWEEDAQLVGGIATLVIMLRVPEDHGMFTVRVTVTERGTQRRAVTARVFEVARP